LKDFKLDFSNFQGIVVIDDMGKIDSYYNRRHTISTFAELCYSHFVSKHTFSASIEISDFHGAAILNVQPIILAEINIDWGIDIDLVQKPDRRYKLYSKLESIAGVQWSDARVLEHLDKMLRATASLDRRQTVTAEDMRLLHKLMKPMTIERHVCRKLGFEVGRYFDTNLAAILVEFASWKNISIERISRDYKISPATAYSLLSNIRDWFDTDETMSKKLIPKPSLRRILKEAGVERWS